MPARTEDQAVQLLERLTLAPGVPGQEGAVRRVVRDELSTLDGLRLEQDGLGSLVIERPGGPEGPRVALDAHLDEVGFMVQSLCEDGTLRLVPLGGWWGHVLPAQRVDVLTDDGERVPGVIGSKPPHFLTPAEREKVQTLDQLYVDIGAGSLAEAEQWGVQVGDAVVPHAEFIRFRDEKILSSKAFDDRVGVGLLVETLLGLEGLDPPNQVVGVAAVQEEVGCRGARTAAKIARPDVGIILEGTPADDSPGFPFDARQAILGQGPQIRFFDPTAISNRTLVRQVQAVAAEHDIPVQIAVRRSGGTDARSVHLHGTGVPTVVIGIPARYIHTHVSLIHLDDYQAARRLLVELVMSLDEETVASLTRPDA